MSHTNTTNLNLVKPEHRDPDTYEKWEQVVNGNMDLIDTAVGSRNYTEHNFINPNEPLGTSLNKLDVALKVVWNVTPSAGEKAALEGEGTPGASNKFTTKDYVRPNRQEVLFPEFAGAVFHPAPSGENIGNMTGDMEEDASYRWNFYKWLSGEVTLQSYDISVQWRLPDTFLSWLTDALIVDICTEDTDPDNCKVDVIISKDGDIGDTSPITDKVSLAPEQWQAARLANAVIDFNGASDTVLRSLHAGDILNITIRVYSAGYYVKVGNITLGYKG